MSVLLYCKTFDKREMQNKSPKTERKVVDHALRKLKVQVIVVEIITDSSTLVTKMFSMLLLIYYSGLSVVNCSR